MSLVERSQDGAIARITLARADKRNALSPELLAALRKALSHARQAKPRCLVLEGEGPVFCAGGDIESMQARLGEPKATEATIQDGINAVVRVLSSFPSPTVAKVQGAAIGAGLGIALACDVTLVAEDATLGATHTRLGLTPDAGTSFLLARTLGPKRALDLLLDARTFDGSSAAEWGLVTEAVPAGELDATVDARARSLAQGPTRAYVKARELVHGALTASLENALEAEALSQAMMYATQDQREGVQAFLEDRDPAFEGR